MGRGRTQRRATERRLAKLQRDGVVTVTPFPKHVWKVSTAVRIDAQTLPSLVRDVARLLTSPTWWGRVWRGVPPTVWAEQKNRLVISYRGRTLLRIPQR